MTIQILNLQKWVWMVLGFRVLGLGSSGAAVAPSLPSRGAEICKLSRNRNNVSRHWASGMQRDSRCVFCTRKHSPAEA